MFLDVVILFNDSFFEVFGQVGADFRCGAFCGYLGDVVFDHELDEFLEGGFVGVPLQLGFRLGGVAPEVDDVGGAVEVGADADDDVAGFQVASFRFQVSANALDDAHFVEAFALEFEGDAGVFEGEVGEFTDGVLDAGGDDEVVGLVLLKDEPHALDIVLGIAPVTEGVHVTEVEAVLYALSDAGCSEGDLAGDEGLATALTLVVEEDA